MCAHRTVPFRSRERDVRPSRRKRSLVAPRAPSSDREARTIYLPSCDQKLLRAKTVRSNAAASSRSTVASLSGYGTSTPLRSRVARRRRDVLSSRRRRCRLSRLTLHLEARTSSRRSPLSTTHHHPCRLNRYSSSFSLSIEGLSGRRSPLASSKRRFWREETVSLFESLNSMSP